MNDRRRRNRTILDRELAYVCVYACVNEKGYACLSLSLSLSLCLRVYVFVHVCNVNGIGERIDGHGGRDRRKIYVLKFTTSSTVRREKGRVIQRNTRA